jgi:methanogenic corrinoid protein MtbC1
LKWKKYLANYQEYNMESPSKEIYTDLIGAKAKAMIGGAPITQSYSAQIGADGNSPDAGHSIAIAGSLI